MSQPPDALVRQQTRGQIVNYCSLENGTARDRRDD